MVRRWISSIPTSYAWKGAYATKWEGFEKARIRQWRIIKEWKIRRINEDDYGIDDIENVCGIYVFLNKGNYVLYIGSSRNLQRRIRQTYDNFAEFQRAYIFKITACQVINKREAEIGESDLLWYYIPPWNTTFHK
ncbi:MAG: GIY-YIG nuclease family protein [candidate division WOR-3 bacterium]